MADSLSAGAAAKQPRAPLSRKLALSCAVLVASALLAELAERVRLSARGAAYDSAATEQAIGALAQRVAERLPGTEDASASSDASLMPHPYFGFDIDSGPAMLASSAQYFRSPAAAQELDVVLVGGSVAAHFARDSGDTLVRLLEADPKLAGRKVRFHRYARGAFKQPQQLNVVAYMYSLGWVPDVVIDLDGFNELALSTYNATQGLHPLHPSQPLWSHLAAGAAPSRERLDALVEIRAAQLETAACAERMLGLGLAKSALLGEFAIARVRAAAAGHERARERYAQFLSAHPPDASALGPPFPPRFEGQLDLMVRNWLESSRSLHALCSARGALYVHVLQPTLLDEGSKPLTARERGAGAAGPAWTNGIRNGYPKLREAGRVLVEQGVHFVDASQLFADVRDDLYYDACHFTAPGNELLAARIAAEVLALLPAR